MKQHVIRKRIHNDRTIQIVKRSVIKPSVCISNQENPNTGKDSQNDIHCKDIAIVIRFNVINFLRV